MKKIDALRLLKEQGFRYVFFHSNGMCYDNFSLENTTQKHD